MNRPEPVGDGADALSMSKARDEPTLHDGEDGALSLHRSVGRWIQDASHLPVALGTDTQEGPDLRSARFSTAIPRPEHRRRRC